MEAKLLHLNRSITMATEGIADKWVNRETKISIQTFLLT